MILNVNQTLKYCLICEVCLLSDFYGGYLIKSNNKFQGNNSHNSTLLIQKFPLCHEHTMNTKAIIHTSLALFSSRVHVLIWPNIHIFFLIKNSGI